MRNFLNLPSSAPTIGLYNEYGIIPIKYRLYQRKLGMWKRINREETNNIIRECKKEQISKELPWCKELVAIANELEVDLEEAKIVSKEVWKQRVSRKVFEKVKRDFMEGMGNLRRYSNNATDETVPGKMKHYMKFTQRKAKVWMRARLDLLDPAPRRPYRIDNIWECKFCDANEQSTEHYIVHCQGVNDIFNGIDRKLFFERIQTLEMNNEQVTETTKNLTKLYNRLI